MKAGYNHPMNNKNHTPGTLTKISLAKSKKPGTAGPGGPGGIWVF